MDQKGEHYNSLFPILSYFSGSPLHTAAMMGNTIMMRTLLEGGMFWVDEEDSKGRTALHYSVQQNSTELTSLLLSKGANVDAVDYNGSSAAHFACKEGMIDAVNLLAYYKADLCAVDKNGKTPFDLACEYGRAKVSQLN
uniref:ANK_REP_REGION domain-containing protein n=1 Tax=Ascaris lumbricoides TaxID=6252 RepID=A0A0M3I2P5_ASCLU